MKKKNKRLESTKEYVDALQDKYSKLNVIRIDLGYKKDVSDSITLEDINKDFNRLLNNRRNNCTFDGNVGYVAKKEDGEERGLHIHAMFFYDGQKIHKDILKGKQIGEYWEEVITKGKGNYHNCNMNDYKEKGVGMLAHNDKEKREKLNTAMSYLCKDDEQHISATNGSVKNRAFVRGTIPKKKSTKGRPRKELSE